jgi:hypothetical protein
MKGRVDISLVALQHGDVLPALVADEVPVLSPHSADLQQAKFDSIRFTIESITPPDSATSKTTSGTKATKTEKQLKISTKGEKCFGRKKVP